MIIDLTVYGLAHSLRVHYFSDVLSQEDQFYLQQFELNA